MDITNTIGWLSVIPPILTIAMALITKEVIASLVIGILSGTLIYTGGDFLSSITLLFETMSEKIFGQASISDTGTQISNSNAYILIFLALLGALVMVINNAGGSKAYGDWASKKIKSRKGAALATTALGGTMFIDDYFNCLAVGAVMRPVTDKYNISRSKLAYIIDSMAGPICIIVPISSWAAAIGSTITDSGIENGIFVFLKTIPYNFYAIITIIMVIYISSSNFNFGPMKKSEEDAIKNGVTDMIIQEDVIKDVNANKSKSHVIDLFIPIGSLIIITIYLMLLFGDFFSSNISITQALGNTDVNLSLVIGAFSSLIISFFLFVPRRLISYKNFMESINSGVKTMVPSFLILILAWTMGGISRDFLKTGEFVGELIQNSNISVAILPAIIFLVSGVLSFSMGTSWGTFAILIPIVIEISSFNQHQLLIPILAATLGGAVLGDHCSPISDTTILASAGAQCEHISHVSTQMPYALLVGGCCFVGYLIVGITNNLIISFISTLLIFILSIFIIKIYQKKNIKDKI